MSGPSVEIQWQLLMFRSGQNLPLPTNSEQHEGDLTYYGTGLGSCGITSSDSDMIVAVSHYVFDAASKSSDPNQNPLCGLKLRASRYDEQVGERRSVDLKVVDRCECLHCWTKPRKMC